VLISVKVRHSAINCLIERALAATEIPARVEPSRMLRNDGKRRDGLTGAVVTRQVLGVGLHMFRHSGHEPSASSNNCCLYSRR